MVCVAAPPGDQLYVPPGIDGVALRLVMLPWQVRVSFTVTEGGGDTMMVPEPLVGLQPGGV